MPLLGFRAEDTFQHDQDSYPIQCLLYCLLLPVNQPQQREQRFLARNQKQPHSRHNAISGIDNHLELIQHQRDQF